MSDEIIAAGISGIFSLAVGALAAWATLQEASKNLESQRDDALKAKRDAESECARTSRELVHTKNQLTQTNSNLAKVTSEHSELLGRLWTWHSIEHHIILDGESHSGKSTLVMKWANPTVPYNSFAATRGVASIPLHLCSELDQANRVERRHQLYFHDIAGEEGQYLNRIISEKRPEFAVIVVDPERLAETKARFSHHLIKVVYANPELSKMLRGILIYVSKVDIARASNVHIEAMAFAQSIREWLIPYYRNSGSVEIVCGDARTGEGIPDALAFIVKGLNLHNLMPKHPSMKAG